MHATTCPVGTDLDRAAALIRQGRLVAFPTETVYGLGAHACDPLAVARIFEAKGRPWFDPLIVHVADVAAVRALVTDFPPAAARLAARFWPGPLTLILPKGPAIPDLVTAGLPTVGLRIPAHPLAQALLRTAGVPVAAPSANLFGRISPTTALHVAEQLGDRIDYILDGGPCPVGIESTILALEPTPMLLRPGGVPLEDLEAELGHPIPLHSPAGGDATPVAAPGLLAQHYAPRTPLRILTREELSVAPPAAWGRAGRLSLAPLPHGDRFATFEVLSETGDLRVAAAAFFSALRRLDAAGLDVIVAEPFPETGLGRGLNDRLRRAAHP